MYDRALSASEIQDDMADPVGAPAAGDTQAPTVPGNLRSTERDGHERLARLERVDRRRRRDRLRRLPRRHARRVAGRNDATVTGLACGTTYTFAVDAVRRRREPLRAGDAHRGDGRLPDRPGHRGAHGADRAREDRLDADRHHRLVDGLERQLRRHRLRHVPRRRADREADGHLVHLHRPRVRHELLARRRRRRRGRQPLGAGDDQRVDERVPAAARQRRRRRRRATSARPARRPRASRSPGTRPPTTSASPATASTGTAPS